VTFTHESLQSNCVYHTELTGVLPAVGMPEGQWMLSAVISLCCFSKKNFLEQF